MQVTINDPKINLKQHSQGCRCLMVEVTTRDNETLILYFENIDDAKAFHGMIGFALGIPL